MDPISNVDRIAVLLQQKLRERARAAGSERTEKGSSRDRPIAGFEAAQALAAIDGINERQRRRVFIQTILAEQFDAKLINDAQFQQVVARVSQAIEEDEASSALLTQLIDDLRRT